jgi:Fur family peroxide stress response transcriptional regulator
MAVSQAELDRRIRRFMETFSRIGMRVTHQRAEIFREAAGSDEHLEAEMIYQRVRKRVTGISRDTVYRTLAMLESEGLIRKAEVLGGSARFDANLDQHHHFVCTVCGAVKDFRSKALDDLPIPDAVKALGNVDSAQVHVRGVCAACMDRKAKGR